MKNKFNKIIISLIVIIILLFMFDCASLHHDKINPCSKGEYQDSVECDYWKKNFPNEYKRYIKRLEKPNQK